MSRYEIYRRGINASKMNSENVSFLCLPVYNFVQGKINKMQNFYRRVPSEHSIKGSFNELNKGLRQSGRH